MRVANHNGLEPALALDEVDRCLVQERNQVPEYVARRRLQQDRALPDAELLARRGGVGEAGRQLCGRERLGRDVVDSGVVGVGLESVFLQAVFFFERGPCLA